MRRLIVPLCLALLAAPAVAGDAADKTSPSAEAKGADDDEKTTESKDDDAEDDDDILAPVRSADERAPTVVPVKDRALKVGLLPLVAIGDAGKPLADSLTTELMKAFNESASVETKALALVVTAGGAVDVDAANAARKQGDEWLAKGRQLLGKLQFGKAKKAFETALAAYEKAAPVLEDPTPLSSAWLGLAEVAASQAQEDEARRCLAFVVAYNPDVELDKKRYPGLFLTFHRKVRDELLKGERAKIFVDESATGAAITVDGRPAKSAPARISGLLPGAHLVRALREGLPPWGAVLVVQAGQESTLSPGFLSKDTQGPGEDLAQNKLSTAAAAVVAEAARSQSLKAGIVGVVTKDGGKAILQLVYVDAASGKIALLPQTSFSASLLDVGIEALKVRTAMEELAGADAPALVDAAGSPLIEGARAGAAVTVAEVTIKYDAKVSKDTPAARKADDEEDEDEEDGERTVAESKSGTRKSLDDEKDPYASDGGDVGEVPEGAPITRQAWFMPTVITAGVVGAVVVAAGTGAALVAFRVLPDPRPASGAQIVVSLPTAAAP